MQKIKLPGLFVYYNNYNVCNVCLALYISNSDFMISLTYSINVELSILGFIFFNMVLIYVIYSFIIKIYIICMHFLK